MNPRYLIYCQKHEKTSDEMLAFDHKRFPGGVMAGFIMWINKHARAFKQTFPESCIGGHIVNQDKFTKFLETAGGSNGNQ